MGHVDRPCRRPYTEHLGQHRDSPKRRGRQKLPRRTPSRGQGSHHLKTHVFLPKRGYMRDVLEPSGRRRRILVIDDDAGIRLIMRLNLEQHGYHVVVADNGVDGLLQAQEQRHDAIVLDLMMPVVDGFQVLAALREDERTKDVPVIVLTAVPLGEAHQQAMWLGAQAVETKPIEPEHLVAVIDAVVPKEAIGRNP